MSSKSLRESNTSESGKTGVIALNNIQLFGYHGLHNHEKQQGNAFVVDVEVDFPFTQTLLHDNMETSLDYGVLFNCIRETIEGPSRNLLETLILEMETRILSALPEVQGVRISLKKMNPPVDGTVGSSEVRISWPR